MTRAERRSRTSRGPRRGATIVLAPVLGLAACAEQQENDQVAVDHVDDGGHDDHAAAPGRAGRRHVDRADRRQGRVHRRGDAGRTCSRSATSSTSTSRPARRRRTRPTARSPRDGRWTFAPDATARLPHPRARARAGGPQEVQRHRGRRVAERQRRRRRRSRLGEPARGDRASRRRVGRRVGAAHRRRGRARAREGRRRPGAEAAGKGLKAIDPARYGSLEHPGDGFSFDIFTQVARAVRAGAGLDGLQPQAGHRRRRVAVGVRARHVLQRRATAHARVRRLLRAQPRRGRAAARRAGQVRRHRRRDRRHADDLPHRSGRADPRHPDRDRRREHPQLVRGAPARQRSLPALGGRRHRARRPRTSSGASAKYIDCGVPINNGPMHIVAKAALRALTNWVDTGTRRRSSRRASTWPPGATPEIRRNADGIALGGIRTPPVDVPGRGAVGRARARTRRRSACCSVRRSRSPRRGSRSSIRHAPPTCSATTPPPTRRSRPASRSPRTAPPCSRSPTPPRFRAEPVGHPPRTSIHVRLSAVVG